MMKVFRLVLLTAIAALFALPAQTQARNPFTYHIVVSNPTNYHAWITIYSLGKVRIETSGRVGAHSRVNFSNGTFTSGSFHHVRYEFMKGNSVACDTSIQVLVTKNEYGNGAFVSGYYPGGSHCHLTASSSSRLP